MATLVDWIKYLIGLADPENLRALVNLSGPWWVSYLILWAIIFSETGLLIGFFLPGDSLLFGAGLLASQDVFNVGLLIVLLSVAAVVGDAVNFYLGLQMSEHVFERGRLRFVKHSHLMAAKHFYEKHGGKAIILARFMPLVRTFTPVVAGVAQMRYRDFAAYNIIGGAGWVGSMTLLGYGLGLRFPILGEHIEKVIILIVFLSILPAAISFLKERRKAKAEAGQKA